MRKKTEDWERGRKPRRRKWINKDSRGQGRFAPLINFPTPRWLPGFSWAYGRERGNAAPSQTQTLTHTHTHTHTIYKHFFILSYPVLLFFRLYPSKFPSSHPSFPSSSSSSSNSSFSHYHFSFIFSPYFGIVLPFINFLFFFYCFLVVCRENVITVYHNTLIAIFLQLIHETNSRLITSAFYIYSITKD